MAAEHAAARPATCLLHRTDDLSNLRDAGGDVGGVDGRDVEPVERAQPAAATRGAGASAALGALPLGLMTLKRRDEPLEGALLPVAHEVGGAPRPWAAARRQLHRLRAGGAVGAQRAPHVARAPADVVAARNRVQRLDRDPQQSVLPGCQHRVEPPRQPLRRVTGGGHRVRRPR